LDGFIALIVVVSILVAIVIIFGFLVIVEVFIAVVVIVLVVGSEIVALLSELLDGFLVEILDLSLTFLA
jgi:hypothetical protein